jgi:hypothetical protein
VTVTETVKLDDWKLFTGYEEVTRETGYAFEFAWRSAERATEERGARFEALDRGAELRFLSERYLTVVRGQASATAHGMHGAHPDRVSELRKWSAATGYPVRYWFVEPRNKDPYRQVSYWVVITDPDAPPAEVISYGDGPKRRRYGWRVRDLVRHEGPIPFPLEIPRMPPRDQLGLGVS